MILSKAVLSLTACFIVYFDEGIKLMNTLGNNDGKFTVVYRQA